jgi:hypothetical protein
MADVSSAQIDMSTARALIVQADSDGCRILLHNRTGTVVYIGGDDVLSTTGMGIDSAAGPVEITLPANAKLYGITASGTPSIQILKIGN